MDSAIRVSQIECTFRARDTTSESKARINSVFEIVLVDDCAPATAVARHELDHFYNIYIYRERIF